MLRSSDQNSTCFSETRVLWPPQRNLHHLLREPTSLLCSGALVQLFTLPHQTCQEGILPNFNHQLDVGKIGERSVGPRHLQGSSGMHVFQEFSTLFCKFQGDIRAITIYFFLSLSLKKWSWKEMLGRSIQYWYQNNNGRLNQSLFHPLCSNSSRSFILSTPPFAHLSCTSFGTWHLPDGFFSHKRLKGCFWQLRWVPGRNPSHPGHHIPIPPRHHHRKKHPRLSLGREHAFWDYWVSSLKTGMHQIPWQQHPTSSAWLQAGLGDLCWPASKDNS